jgi:MFS family permease
MAKAKNQGAEPHSAADPPVKKDLEFNKMDLLKSKLATKNNCADSTQSEESQGLKKQGFMQYVDKTTMYMNLVIMSSMISFYLFAPFLPLEIERMNFDTKKVGFIMSIYSVTNFISSCCLGKILPYFSKRRLMVVTLCIMGSTMVMFALLQLFHLQENPYVMVSMSLRAIQGVCSSTLFIIIYSISLSIFNEDKQKALASMFKVSGGIGITLGPVIGGQLYQNLGYMAPFFFAASMFFIAAPLGMMLIPASADNATIKKKNNGDRSVGFFTLICKPMIMMPVMMNVMIQLQLTYLEPILALRLKQHYGLSLEMNNAFFILLPGSYLVGAILYQTFFSFLNRVDNKVIIITASASSLFACLLCGPSEVLLLTDNVAFIGVGFALLGFTGVIIGIPLIAEQNTMT